LKSFAQNTVDLLLEDLILIGGKGVWTDGGK
jgi:hypothetical protein